MLHSQLDGLGQIPLEGGDGDPRPQDPVGRNPRENTAGQGQGPPGGPGVTGPTQHLQHPVVEALHPQADPPDALEPPGRGQFRGEGLGVGLGGQLQTGVAPQPAQGPGQQILHEVRLEAGRGAAADVARGDRPPSGSQDPAPLAAQLQLPDHAADVPAAQLMVVTVGAGEMAVGADRTAERDVDVESHGAPAALPPYLIKSPIRLRRGRCRSPFQDQ